MRGNHPFEGSVIIADTNRRGEGKDEVNSLLCPHCGESIELVGQRELTEKYHLGPNPVAALRQQGSFPAPVLSFGNRNMWFREQVESYLEERRQLELQRFVEGFKEKLAELPETERAEAIKMLDPGTPRKRAH